MQTTDALRRRLETAEDLRSIVRTMKALSIVSIRQYEDALVALEEYARGVDLAMRALFHVRPDALSRLPAQRAVRAGAVVIGSDQGLCGAFSEQIVARFLEGRAAGETARTDARVLAVGARAAHRLEDGGVPASETLALPASAPLIASLAREILERIDAWRASGAVDGVHLYFNRPDPRTIYRPHNEVLLPLDVSRLRALAAVPWRPRALPALATAWEPLLPAVVREHLVMSLHRALAQSLASEHAARRAAMHAAERNIDDRLLVLRGEFNEHRQSSITTELLDIVSGYEVLTGDEQDGHAHAPAPLGGRTSGAHSGKVQETGRGRHAAGQRRPGSGILRLHPTRTTQTGMTMRVSELMRSDLKTVGPDAPVAEIVQTMAEAHVSGLPVVTPDRNMLGVVSATDVLEAAAERDDEEARADLFENTTARDLMTAKPLVIGPEADVREAAQQMLYAEVKRLFVEDGGRLVGVISQTDIAFAVGTGRL